MPLLSRPMLRMLWPLRSATQIPRRLWCFRPSLEHEARCCLVCPLIYEPAVAQPAEARLNPSKKATLAILPLLLAWNLHAAQIRFTYENPKLQPHKYVITVAEDGSGHFTSEVTPTPDDQGMGSASQDRPI